MAHVLPEVPGPHVPRTLCIDVGGTGLKALVLRRPPRRGDTGAPTLQGRRPPRVRKTTNLI